MKDSLNDYVHRPFSDEIIAIGGHYRFTDELRLTFEGSQLLYLKGYAVFDTTCCGAGGCSYILVKGFIEKWKTRKDGDFYVSQIRPVKDDNLKNRIIQHLKEKELVQQVQFA
jgi:hypothetical protein